MSGPPKSVPKDEYQAGFEESWTHSSTTAPYEASLMGNLLQDYILNLCLKIPFSAYIVPMELTICRRLRHHKKSSGTSPVVQWLRIHLSRDVHWIPGWGTKIPHTCRATKPTETREPGCSRARDPQQEKPSCMLQLSATTKTQHNPKEGKVVT